MKGVTLKKATPEGCHLQRRDVPEFQTGWIYGELHIPSLVSGSEPKKIIIDFDAFRTHRLESAQFHAIALSAIEFSHHPLTRAAVPKITLPVVAFPAITLSLSLPKAEFPKQKVAATANLASHFSLAFAVALALLFAGPIAILETQSLVSKASRSFNQQTVANAPTATIPVTATPAPTPEITSPHDVFSIAIPELGIESTITPNVDPANPQSYKTALKEGIAHAAGTGLPEQLDINKTIYLFAHSTDAEWNIKYYNAEFYSLKDAEIGQVITVRFWGQDYRYAITDKQIVAANDTTWLVPQQEKEQLVLQTCYPPGTTWKRLLVVAEPLTEDDTL